MDLSTHGILVEAEVRRCVAEIYINDFPVGLCGHGTIRGFNRPVHEFLVDGENELSVLINPGDTPATSEMPSRRPKAAWGAQPPPSAVMDAFLETSEPEAGAEDKQAAEAALAQEAARESGGAEAAGTRRQQKAPEEWTVSDVNFDVEGLPAYPSSRVQARLMRYPKGAMSGDGTGETLIGIDWQARSIFGELREERQPYPRWVHQRGDLGSMFGPLSWQKLHPLKLNRKLSEDLRRFILFVRDCIENGEADPIVQRSVDRFKEVTTAYGLAVADRANLFQQLLTEESGKAHWIFETPDEGDWSFRICGGGRVVECIASDWRPVVRMVNDPVHGQFIYPMFVAHKKNDWTIVR